ncbi:substrate-binding domain-containing protein [Botrimarina sp.]|uniref:substrate-binding domain-containing protein n=1 Tax=Botrimarina sp. TaxID=2795802 RepID=UPI0032EEA5E1
MLKSKSFWAIAAVAVVAAIAYRGFAAPQEAEGPAPKRVAFITGGPGDYWEAAIAGAQAAALDKGIELDVRSPTDAENIEQQMQLLSVAGSSQVDGVAISPIDADRQTKLITQVAGLKPLVTFDADASESARHGYVGTSNFSAGLVAGTLVKKAIPEGKIAVLLANKTKENVVDRLAGLKARIAESPVPEESATDPRFEIIGVYADDGDNDRCRELIRDVLDEHPDLACLVTLNARQGPVATEALESAGKIEQVKHIAFDTPPETLDAVEQGKVFAAIAQDPYSYGYEAIGMIDALCRGDEQSLPVTGRAAVHISVEPITKENLADYRERLASRKPPLKQQTAAK